MKYTVLLPVTIEADPADFRGAAQKGFEAIADLYNGYRPAKIHLVPQDGSDEANLTQAILSSTFTASTTFCD
ncbi:hypothetical protein [Hymenobacter fodinae]|uniref:hypothetical protein n=1 Tax=Hymenobacter fodinae TaxID=2510796 RepID=UPI001AEBB63E|nr:hypothetical protein [Hymenobacter fodinae]